MLPAFLPLACCALNATAELWATVLTSVILCIHFQFIPDHIAQWAQQICQFLLNINLEPFAFHWESFGTSTCDSEPDPAFHSL